MLLWSTSCLTECGHCPLRLNLVLQTPFILTHWPNYIMPNLEWTYIRHHTYVCRMLILGLHFHK